MSRLVGRRLLAEGQLDGQPGCLGIRSVEGIDGPDGLIVRLETHEGQLARLALLGLEDAAVRDG